MFTKYNNKSYPNNRHYINPFLKKIQHNFKNKTLLQQHRNVLPWSNTKTKHLRTTLTRLISPVRLNQRILTPNTNRACATDKPQDRQTFVPLTHPPTQCGWPSGDSWPRLWPVAIFIVSVRCPFLNDFVPLWLICGSVLLSETGGCVSGLRFVKFLFFFILKKNWNFGNLEWWG